MVRREAKERVRREDDRGREGRGVGEEVEEEESGKGEVKWGAYAKGTHLLSPWFLSL